MPRYLVRTFEVEQAAMPDVGRRSIAIAKEEFPEIIWEHSHVIVDDLWEIAGDVTPADFPPAPWRKGLSPKGDCPCKTQRSSGRVLGTVARWQSLLASEHPLVADPPGEAVCVETLQQQLRYAA